MEDRVRNLEMRSQKRESESAAEGQKDGIQINLEQRIEQCEIKEDICFGTEGEWLSAEMKKGRKIHRKPTTLLI
jgi:hypothetical protein